MNNTCLFCKIINNEINSSKIYENKYVVAFLDINPASDGHSLLIPKKHFNNLSETDDIYLIELAKAKKIVANHLYDKLKCSGFNYLSNEKHIAGQRVFHLHYHIIPKYKEGIGFNIKQIDPTTNINIKNISSIYKKIGKIN